MKTSGIEALLEMLAQQGVRYIFGNPGTTEMPLNDALVGDRRLQYILGLQEVPVMAMADGYAMASGTLGVVNLHISCGLGNAMGMLYNAYREGTPLLVTAGPAGPAADVRRADPVGADGRSGAAVDEVGVRSRARRGLASGGAPRDANGPHAADRSGVHVAADRRADGGGRARSDAAERLRMRCVRPPVEAMRRAAEVLAGAKNPAILAGSRVTERDAVDELVRVAERLGAPVITESGTTHGRLAFPPIIRCTARACRSGRRKSASGCASTTCCSSSAWTCCGNTSITSRAAIPEHSRLVQLDEDPWQIGKNYPLEVGVIGDTKAGARRA